MLGLCLVSLCSVQVFASSFIIKVSKKLVTDKASLILCLLDEKGNSCIGKCQLDAECQSRKISQDELEMSNVVDIDKLSCEMKRTKAVEIDNVSHVLDLTDFCECMDQPIVLCFEFDRSLALVRVLVVKDCLLEEDPFNVFEFSVESTKTNIEECDEFSDLISSVDSQTIACAAEKKSKRATSNSSLMQKYMLYAEIFALLQYNKAKHALRNVGAWLVV